MTDISNPLLWLGGQIDIKVQVATGSNAGSVWDVGEWDDAVWSPAIPGYEDITQYLERATIRRGQERWDSRFSAGVATFVFDNKTGLFTPNAGENPFGLPFRPGRYIRIVMIPDPDEPETQVVRFTGRIAASNDRFSNGNIVTVVSAVDALGDLRDHNPVALDTATGVEDTDVRITTALDRMDWPLGQRLIQGGLHTMQTSFLAQTSLEECMRAADAEGGLLYVDGDNNIVFKNRDWFVPSVSSMDTYEAVVLAAAPVAYWRMGDDTDRTVDSTGNGHTLTWSGSPASGVTGVEADDLAQPLDGSNDYASVASEGDLELHQDMSIECWVRPHGADGNIIECRGAAGVLYRVGWINSVDGFLFGPGDFDSQTDVTNLSADPNEWSHLVLTVDWDGSNRILRKYVNGEYRGSSTFTYQPAVETRAVIVGRWATSNILFFDGDISELAVYDKVLTEAEVLAHYEAKDIASNARAVQVQGWIGYEPSEGPEVINPMDEISAEFWDVEIANTHDTLSIVSGKLVFQAEDQHNSQARLETSPRYDLNDSAISVEVTDVALDTGGNDDLHPLALVSDDLTIFFYLYYDGGTILRWGILGGGSPQDSTTYNSTNHRWLRIREDAGQFHFEVSSDGETWTTLDSFDHGVSGSALLGDFSINPQFTYASNNNSTITMDNLTYERFITITAPIYDDIDTDWDRYRVRNDIQFARSGGTLQTVEDAESQSLYGVMSYSRRDYHNNSDAEVLTLAERQLAAHKDARPRLEKVTIAANDDPDNEDLNRLYWDSRFGDLIAVKIPTLRGWDQEIQTHIIGIEDEITAQEWKVTFVLDDSILAILDEE